MLKEPGHGIEFPGFNTTHAKSRSAKIRENTGLGRVLFSLEFHSLSRWPDRKTPSVARMNNRSSDKNRSKIASAIEYIVANYTERLSLSRFAAVAGLSEGAFSRYFHAANGNCFTEFVSRVRVGQARIKLYETNDKISSICYDVGFPNIANFNRQLAKIKDKTSRAFRSKARKGLIA